MAKDFGVVVLGGYGNFGQVIVQRLAATTDMPVWIAGRDLARAEALAEQSDGQALRLDMNAPDLAERLRATGAHLLISTAGPFQGQDYRVARAAMAAGMHYADLADARAFVCGIGELDAAAKAAGVLVCGGASSVPALAGAVVDALLPRFSRLDLIWHGISSSEKTPGVSTVAAVLNYCGKPFRQWRGGAWRTVYGWQDLARHDFPAPLGPRWVANCDIPDLELFPQRYPGVREVRFSAGVGLLPTQFGTWALSWLVRAGLLRDAVPLAGFLQRRAVALEGFGDGRSGMFVRLEGVGTDGRPLRLCWELLAEDNDGPNIPCMAAVALARKLAAGTLDARGAMPCLGLLSREDYLAELEGLAITSALREY
ncbi:MULTISPECIES: saccharopine dehydrogenase NADP-binding domain-containing protein [unclassified Pseudomonas]|uniref:saccharopine dehydrogenase family protein n=1 Tax=unclassified Pseudomonas TaxID=196821 RepID=UPI002448D1AF|nr:MULTISPECIES: saccharopine dehydrogenase NADP-binding domain-containing protein [unclassified Pseudomonas]MDG9929602.1 saccharopine dehydrogenase NADP-binding domain-containing protein [Pseudomonas sp. GD04042]MDH0483377.1 saccharopine dehydrogenase NADP-binding domain-containing protein [Pseudomonas sp. GD04015]MDH0604820.1 saccharopine dehydrogenase NADP-binding domain-containing protein [Pseudomonas sp. GD03869]